MLDMQSTAAALDAKKDAVQAEYDALWLKTFAHCEIPPPPFEEVVAALERDPQAALATYAPMRDRIVADKAEHAADALRLKALKVEADALRADAKERARVARQVAKEAAVASYLPKFEGWTAPRLEAAAAEMHSRLKRAMFGTEYKFGGYVRDEGKIERLDNELDAMALLLSTRHDIHTSYADNAITFAKKDAGELAGAKRLKRD